MDELAVKLRRRATQFRIPFDALFAAVAPVARPDMPLAELREYEHRKPGRERYTLDAARKWARDLDATLHNHGMMNDLVIATGLPPEKGAEKVGATLDAVSELANLLTLTEYGEFHDGRRQYEVAELLPRLSHVWESAGHEKSNYWNPSTHQIVGRQGKHHAPASEYCQFLYWVTDDAFGMQKAKAVHGFLNSTTSGQQPQNAMLSGQRLTCQFKGLPIQRSARYGRSFPIPGRRPFPHSSLSIAEEDQRRARHFGSASAPTG